MDFVICEIVGAIIGWSIGGAICIYWNRRDGKW